MSARVVALLAAISISTASSATQPDPIYRETVIRHGRPRMAGEKFDPQETNPKLRVTFAAADAAAERRVGNVKRDDRFVFRFWSEKKKLLRQTYRIDWKTPAELNPTIMYGPYGQPRLTSAELRAITPVVRRHFRHRSESITSAERTFEGTAEVWTNGPAGVHRYELRGHDQQWRFIDSHLVLP